MSRLDLVTIKRLDVVFFYGGESNSFKFNYVTLLGLFGDFGDFGDLGEPILPLGDLTIDSMSLAFSIRLR